MSALRLPIDRLLAGYNALLAVLWLAAAGLPDGAGPAAVHVAACALPGTLDRVHSAGFRPAGWLREWYPVAFLFGFWGELGHLLPVLHPVTHDAAIARLDLAIFGVHWNVRWMQVMPMPWLNELLFSAYLLYLPLLVLPIGTMTVRGRGDAAQDMIFRLLVTFVACYLLYLVFPVLGPRESLAAAQGLEPRGFFAGISEALRDRGDSLGTAFPSSHAAGAVTVAFLGARWLGSVAARLLAVQAGAVVLATVYTGNHYAVDAAAGVVLALGLQWLLVPRLLVWLTPTPRRAVPLLPRFETLFPARLPGRVRS